MIDARLFELFGHVFTVQAAATLASAVVIAAVGLYVLAVERVSAESMRFFGFTALVSVWLGGFALMYSAPDRAAARRWFEVAYLATPLLPAALYQLTVSVLSLEEERRVRAWLLWMVGGALVVAVAGGGLILDGFVREPWGWMVRFGTDALVLIAWIGGGVGLSLWEYWRTRRTEEAERPRRQSLRLLVGFGLGSLAVTDFLPSMGVGVPPLGYLVVVTGILLIARGIQLHQLVVITPAFASRTVLDTMAEPVLMCDADGRVRVANAALERVLGRSPDEVEGRPAGTLASGDGEVREGLDRLARGEAEGTYGFELTAEDGRRVVTRFSASVLRDGGGAPVGSVLVARDVTEERVAYEALETSREKFATVFHVNPHALSIATLEEGRFLEVNRGFEDLYGYRREEAVGRTAAELGLWPDPEDREQVAVPLRAGRTVRDEEVRLRTRDGDLLHVLFSGETLELEGRTCVVAAAHDITDRKRFEEELQRQALHDSLTGLPNRSLFENRLEHACRVATREEGRVAVVFLDLEGFSRVNDSLGHAAGDELLTMVAGRLTETLRAADTVARTGGDEFAVLLEDVDEDGEASQAAERILRALETPFVVAQTTVRIDATAGIALGPERAETPGVLLQHAAVATLRAKAMEGVRHRVFDPETDAGATRRLQRENELRTALDRGQMELWYQPIVRLEDASVVGVEGLVRWRHPDRGIVPPGEFVPLAEETGLIGEMGRQVMEMGCRDVAGWRRGDGALSDVTLNLNLSAKEFHQRDLPGSVDRALEEAGLPPEALHLEVTESAVIRGRARLRELRELGVGVDVDDFGTGYSSLAYLKELEVDGLKIDRTFVGGLDPGGRDRAIVDAVMTLARQLELGVVAEGVEEPGQLEVLRELGCSTAQGFLFARPRPGTEWRAEMEAYRNGG